MQNRQLSATGVLLSIFATLIPFTAQAGGSSFSITEINPQIRTLEAGKNSQLVKELEVSLYNEEISSLNDMEFYVSCDNIESLKKVSVGQGTKTLGSSTFQQPIPITLDGVTNTYPTPTLVKAVGSEIKNGTDEKFWVKFDVADTDKTSFQVCSFLAFNFVEKSTGTNYGPSWSYEEVASQITPIVVIGSTQEGPVKDALEVDMKKLGALTYKLGSQNQLIYMADVTANKDLTIDDILFTCQDSGSLKELKLKNQTDSEIISTVSPTQNFAPSPYSSPIQSAIFKNLNWQIRGGSTKKMSILGDFHTNGWANDLTKGCSILAMNAHIIDPTNTSKTIYLHPTQIPGIGLKYQTSPLNISYDFIDVSSNDFYYEAVSYLRKTGIINGNSDGLFHPLNKINRAEFAQMIMNVKTQGALIYDVNCSKEEDPKFFGDVPKNPWFNMPICYSFHMGFINGYKDGTFRPEKNVSRAEAIKMALRVADIQTQDEPDNAPWYTPYIVPAKENGLLYFDPELSNPSEEITRGEMAYMIYKVLYSQEKTDLKQAINNKAEQLQSMVGERYIAGDYYRGISGDFQLTCTENAFTTFEETMTLISEFKSQTVGSPNLNNYEIYEWTSNNQILAVLFGVNPEKLHIAVNSNCIDITKNYLEQDNSKLNDTNGYSGKTPLIIAVDNQDESMVDLLLSEGADPNILTALGNYTQWQGLSPLYFAVIHNNTTLLQKLLDSGADINQILEPNSTLLDFAALKSNESTNTYLIQHGAKHFSELTNQ